MRISSAIASLVLLAAVPAALYAGDSDFTDDSVRAAARSSLASFLDKIPVGHETRYGFQKRDEFKRATPGMPLRMYAETPDSPAGGAGDSSRFPTALEEWRVPVLVDGEIRSLLTVARTDEGLEAVELGGAELARELGEFDKKYPGGRRALLRIYRLKCDFLLVDRSGAGFGEGDYHPLRSARIVLNATSAASRSRGELFGEIHRLYRSRSADR